MLRSDRPVFAAMLLAGLAASCAGTESRTGDGPGRGIAPRTEADVRPGINKGYLDPEINVDGMVQRFEGDNREIFVSRAKIARTCGFEKGMAVADIGAGTGLFCFPFAQDVGADGTVYAVEINQKLVDFITNRAAQRKLPQVQPVLGSVRETGLAEDSIDAAFVCDVYHHFNYPQTTLASIYRALRPGGSLILVDFERIEGVSREFILGHVRAGKAVFRAEIEAAGFEFVEEVDLPELKENYFLRFRRP